MLRNVKSAIHKAGLISANDFDILVLNLDTVGLLSKARIDLAHLDGIGSTAVFDLKLGAWGSFFDFAGGELALGVVGVDGNGIGIASPGARGESGDGESE